MYHVVKSKREEVKIMDVVLDNQENDIERRLVERFIVIDAEAKRAASLAEELKRQRDTVEAELLELLNDGGKKASARFQGIGHVTALDPVVSNAYVMDGQDQILFEYLRTVHRDDLIKTGIHHTALAAYVNQCLKSGENVPPGVGFVMKQKLRAYPEK